MVESHWTGSIRKMGEFYLTPEGGIAKQFINNTVGVSVKGTLVESSLTVAGGVDICAANALDATGVVYDSGVAVGDPVWVVFSGIAEVLIVDGTAAALDNWVKVSDAVNGRADASLTAPPGQSFNNIDDHFSEIGHVVGAATAGTDKLAKIMLHFN